MTIFAVVMIFLCAVGMLFAALMAAYHRLTLEEMAYNEDQYRKDEEKGQWWLGYSAQQGQVVERPVTVSAFIDGDDYQLDDIIEVCHSHFLHIERIDDAIIKRPTCEAGNYVNSYFNLHRVSADWIREPEGLECWDAFLSALEEFPEFEKTTREMADTYERGNEELARMATYWLIVHKLHQKKISRIMPHPKAAFIRLALNGRESPSVVQQRIIGTRLWDMFDHSHLALRPEWMPHTARISLQLGMAIFSNDHRFFDFNAQNFMYDKVAEKLYYVDSKPSWFSSKSVSDHNLVGLGKLFLIGLEKERFTACGWDLIKGSQKAEDAWHALFR